MQKHKSKLKRFLTFLLFVFSFFQSSQCLKAGTAESLKNIPQKVIWAWRRPENLLYINPQEFAVAYLSCQVLIEGENLSWHFRDQPLLLPDNTVVIPTLRIDLDHKKSANLSDENLEKIVSLIQRLAKAKNAAMFQIDFDALQSERDFYRHLLKRTREVLPADMPLSITALASWCLFDNWLDELAVDETVPMMFSLGKEREKILLYFASGRDFMNSRSRQSLGLSFEDRPVNDLMIPLSLKRKIPVRIYFYSQNAWTEKKFQELRSILNNKTNLDRK